MKEVTIKDKSFILRYGLKSLFIYEDIVGHPYEGKTLKESYMLLHSCLLAYNEDYTLTFDELIEECDGNESIFQLFLENLTDAVKRDQRAKKKVGTLNL